MQMTWRPAASARSCSPTARAVWPPMPASTSSKTSVARPGLGRDAHQREHHPRELAARRGLAQRAGRARRGSARSGTRPRRRRVGPKLVAVAQRGLERRAVHRQRGEPLAHRLGELAPGRRAGRAQLRGALGSSARASPSARLGALERLLGADELVAARAARLGVGEHRGDRAAVLALQAVQQRQALLDLVQPARRRPRRPRRSGAARGRGPRPRAPAPATRSASASSSASTPRTDSSAREAAPRCATGGALVARHRLHPARGGRRRSASTWRSRSRSAASDASSSSLGSGASISCSSHSSRSSSRSRAPARSRSSSSAPRSSRSRAYAAPNARQPRGVRLAAEAVQDLQLRRGEHELAVLVLAVERQQRAADVAQVGRRRAAAAQVGAGAALGADAPGEHDLLRVVGQPVADQLAQLVGIARTRPRRRPPTRRGARSPAAACRPAAGPAHAPARSCPRRSPRSARSARARGAARPARSAAGSRRAALPAHRVVYHRVPTERGCSAPFAAEPAQSCCRARSGRRNEPDGEQERSNGGMYGGGKECRLEE